MRLFFFEKWCLYNLPNCYGKAKSFSTEAGSMYVGSLVTHSLTHLLTHSYSLTYSLTYLLGKRISSYNSITYICYNYFLGNSLTHSYSLISLHMIMHCLLVRAVRGRSSASKSCKVSIHTIHNDWLRLLQLHNCHVNTTPHFDSPILSIPHHYPR